MDKKDLIGRRFGKLTVMEDSGKRRGNSILWRCRCDCGGEILAVRHQLVSGNRQDCGCVPKIKKPAVADLIGRRFGKLTVEGDSGRRTYAGGILWRCKCDCGGEVLAQRHELLSGNIINCGCVPKRGASGRRAEDLTGRQFGELTVLRRAENDNCNKVRWICKCSCGREVTIQAKQLKSGSARSCGCKRHDFAYNRRNLTGMRFGRLTVLYPAERKDAPQKSVWHCRCDCGKETDVLAGSLLRGLTQSCGCWNKEQSARMHEHMHYQDDTCAEVLRRVCLDTGKRKSKAGFRGLFLMKNGKYRASITFQGKHYNLGHYADFSDAVRARLEAEEILHAGYLRALDGYERQAKENPQWAENNPFFYIVTRVNGDFGVRTNGVCEKT